MPLYYLIPVGTALLYALGAVCIKRSTNDGVGPWRTTFITNLFLFACAQPFWFFGSPIESVSQLGAPFAISITFLIGQLTTCLSIHHGDVSVATPILGTKPILIGLIAGFFFGQPLGATVWVGAVLSAVAILLLRGNTPAEKSRLLPSILLGLASSFFFSINDTFMQVFGSSLGFEKSVATIFTFLGILNLGIVPLTSGPVFKIPKTARNWLLIGSFFNASQGIIMATTITHFGNAAILNIIYGSRGAMSIAIIWLFGHYFANQERDLGKRILLRRFIGSLLLIAAIVFAVT
ncbi:MAG: DMT family transporter [Verrucomicrobiota bacterium]